jgi:hypothetical protein
MAVFNVLLFLVVFAAAYPILSFLKFIGGNWKFKQDYFDLMLYYGVMVEFLWEKIINCSVKILNENDKQTFLN